MFEHFLPSAAAIFFHRWFSTGSGGNCSSSSSNLSCSSTVHNYNININPQKLGGGGAQEQNFGRDQQTDKPGWMFRVSSRDRVDLVLWLVHLYQTSPEFLGQAIWWLHWLSVRLCSVERRALLGRNFCTGSNQPLVPAIVTKGYFFSKRGIWGNQKLSDANLFQVESHEKRRLSVHN